MRSKSTNTNWNKYKKRKPKVIYYAAPAKSRASYFFTSFLLTLVVISCAVGFLIADRNSQRLGWGRDIEVFALTNSGKQIDVTFMGNRFDFDTSYLNDAKIVLDKVRLAQLYVEPESLQLVEIVGERLASLEQEILSKYNFIPKS